MRGATVCSRRSLALPTIRGVFDGHPFPTCCAGQGLGADPEVVPDSSLPHDEEDQACSKSSSDHDERDYFPHVSDQGESESDDDDACLVL